MRVDQLSCDETEILEAWRLVKRYRKGFLRVTLKSDGTQYYLEVTPAKEGRVHLPSE